MKIAPRMRMAGYAASAAEAARQERAARLLADGPPPARMPHDIDLCPLCLGIGDLPMPDGARAWCGACAGTGDAD